MSLDLFPCYHRRADNSGLLTVAEAWDLVPQQVFPEMLLWDRYRATKTESNGTTGLTALLEELSVPGSRQANRADRSYQVAVRGVSLIQPTSRRLQVFSEEDSGQGSSALAQNGDLGTRKMSSPNLFMEHGFKAQGICCGPPLSVTS